MLRDGVIIQRKCGADFVYPNEGCGKTLLKITDTIPHTVVDMGYQGAECTYPHVSTRSECCSVRSLQQENFHIFIWGLAKNTFTICNAKPYSRLTLQMSEKLFKWTTLTLGYYAMDIWQNIVVDLNLKRLSGIPESQYIRSYSYN